MNAAERYRLVRTVASGGMATVIEAVASGHGGFERRVAIKRLLPQHARDGERLERLVARDEPEARRRGRR